MPRRRRAPKHLSEAEQRVLEAFYGGRLPAGQLSAALVEARADRNRPEPVPAPVPLAHRPAPAVASAGLQRAA